MTDVLDQLDLQAKVRLLSGRDFWHLQALADHDVESVMVADGPHGLRRQPDAGDHLGVSASLPATCFPPAATLGSSWDEALVEEVGAAIGTEALAQGVAVVLGPGLNIKRHPACGRNFEYYSEDPVVSGRLAAAFVRGVQSRGVGTSAKHFAVNNQESFRLVVDAVVDERTLRELYLTGFEIVVRESAPWTVMCAYNKVNGTYCSEHTELLTTILRDEWGFEGLVMSDWGATDDRAAGVAAGLDLQMPGAKGAFDGEVIAAVDAGRIAEEDVDRCASRVLELAERGRHTVDPGRGSTFDTAAHHALARRAAAAGTVLLANDGVLPLRTGVGIAVIGAMAEHPRYQGAGSSQVNPTRLDDALGELRRRHEAEGAGTVAYAPGYDEADGSTTDELVRQAVAVAADAEVAVVFAGLPAREESEGFDRRSLDLPEGHLRVIEAVAATATPTVVVFANGGTVHMGWADRVGAVLETYLGGQAGGSAAIDVLFGDAEPGGRLAESVPHHVAQLPADRNFPGQPRQVEYREALFVGYRFHDTAGVPARFAFGHGLSYTTFEWSEPEVAIDGEGDGVRLEVNVRVRNTGERAGSEVVQVYVRRRDSAVYRPDKELRGFHKVHLGPGEEREVSISLGHRAVAVWDVATHRWAVEAGEYEVLVGASSVDLRGSATVQVTSDDVIAAAPRPSGFEATDDEFAAMLGRAIPVPRPLRPFDRNSTLAEMGDSAIGRRLESIVMKVARDRARDEFPDADAATVRMIEAAVREAPARGLVALGGGVMSLDALDGLIDAVNGRWRSAAGRLGGEARRAVERRRDKRRRRTRSDVEPTQEAGS